MLVMHDNDNRLEFSPFHKSQTPMVNDDRRVVETSVPVEHSSRRPAPLSSWQCSSSSSSNSSTQADQHQQRQRKSRNDYSQNMNILFNLPPVVNNSALVRQKASAKETLAAASISAATTVPLMIGGRSKCVVNILPSPAENQQSQSETGNGGSPSTSNQSKADEFCVAVNRTKQNMVSVVRPVIKPSSSDQELASQNYEYPLRSAQTKLNHDSETTINKHSIIDEFMRVENLNSIQQTNCMFNDQFNEQQQKQQALQIRREEYELNKNIRRQHRFLMGKIEERKRNLQIVQSIWFQKDFKHAIEKLVDIYNEGLMLNCNRDNFDNFKNNQTIYLNSSSIVLDVLSVIIMRPKLWNLEICQLLLPIISNDLLLKKSDRYLNYIEIGLKAVKLILNHFSSVIKTTLEAKNDSARLIGVDLSREDRIKKCSNCYKLLMDAKAVIENRSSENTNSKLAIIYRDLQESFAAFQRN